MKSLGGKLLLAVGAPLAFTACATIGPPQPPSLELPKPPTDLRAFRKGDKVVLTWTRPSVTTDRRSLRLPVPVLICRTLEVAMSECGNPVGHFTAGATLAGPPTPGQKAAQIPGKRARITDSFTDILSPQTISAAPMPAGFATYAVEAVNANGRGAGLSNQVRIPLAATLPPPPDFTAKVSAQGVVLTWTGVPLPQNADGDVHFVYRVYRNLEGNQQPVLVGELPAVVRSMTLTDSNIEWEQTYYYRIEALTVIKPADKPEVQIEGDDTPEAKVFTHDIFPPAVPSGLQAVFSGPGQPAFIDLIWAPVTDADLAGYNVYRHEDGSVPVRVNKELVKAPAYRDVNVSAGNTYVYSVSAVDVRGNESERSAEATESVTAE